VFSGDGLGTGRKTRASTVRSKKNMLAMVTFFVNIKDN